ncbi:MAG: hypothetical protein WBO70_07995, partial [Erysipelotrichaceae bacterium]
TDDVILSCTQDYLKRAIEAYEDLGGVYKLSKLERKSKSFNESIPDIKCIELEVVKSNEPTLYRIEFDPNSEIVKLNYELIYAGGLDARSFYLEYLPMAHIGEWESEYDVSKYGATVVDSVTWNLKFTFNSGDVKECHGNNCCPFSFRWFLDLLEIECFIDYI